MVAVSVLVATADPGAGLLPLVRSVDAQTLPASDFELVVVDASTDGSAQRLQELARRRPNVVLLTAETGSAEAARLDLARQHASGERVLVLAQDRRLTPRALELLLERARTSGADVVRGRVVGGSPAVPADDSSAIALVRRDGTGAPTGTLVALTEERYACAVEEHEPSADDAGITIVSSTVRWRRGELQVAARVATDRRGLRAWLVAAQEGVDLAVDAEVSGSGAVAATLDPLTAEAGRPLADGLWDLRLRFAWPGGETTLPLAAAPTAAAVVAGRPFVVRTEEGAVQLDAGATLGGVTGPAPQSTATVAESASGILLTLEQPDLHVHGDAQLDARLLLDGFALRARLVCSGGAARVEAFASSLAGVSTIRLAVGGGAPVPTGLRLRVDGVGAMRVEPVPVVVPAPQRPSPLVQRVRRRAPRALEPVVRRLSRVPALRRAYRALLTR